MALDGDAHRAGHAAFVNGDLEGLHREINHSGLPEYCPDHTIGLPLLYSIHHSPPAFVGALLDAGADPNSDSGR